jgi:hypothetical protein
VQIGQAVAVRLNRSMDTSLGSGIGQHVEQDRSCVADQAIGPTRNDAGSHNARKGVHPQPAEAAGQKQPDDDQHRHGGVRHDVNDSGAHVVVALRAVIVVIVFAEGKVTYLLPYRVDHADMDFESVRLGNVLAGFQIVAPVSHKKHMRVAAWPNGRDGQLVRLIDASKRTRKRGGTPSSNIPTTRLSLPVAMRCSSSWPWS